MKAAMRFLSALMILCFFASCSILDVNAELVNIEGNAYFTQSKIPTGKTGQIMNVTFKFTTCKSIFNFL